MEADAKFRDRVGKSAELANKRFDPFMAAECASLPLLDGLHLPHAGTRFAMGQSN